MRKIIYTQKNGIVAIVFPVPKERIEVVLGPMTDEEYATHVWERSVPADAINPRYVTDEEVDAAFSDETFRDAWIDDNGIKVDMAKARGIHMDRIRHARNEKLKELDIETMKGSDVQSQKQVLRDLPQTLNLSVAKTPEELKAIWPDQLK